ncbi:MAG: 4'-phosphopantetheinyl transferase superfamily protein [Oscillospiraceae bacterium]|nr:4'-phosphopantetheinyl transferase superfamily protein [Oscillospiraceae bacterium]
MISVSFFEITGHTDLSGLNKLPESVRTHCKKRESAAAALALTEMGISHLQYEKSGKPIADNCFVSISHSGSAVAVCKSDTPVGIDIEKIDRERNFERIVKRFYHGEEVKNLFKNPSAEKFYEIWTKKEAYSKIFGGGLADIMNGFDVYSPDGVKFQTYKINEYIITVCEKIRKEDRSCT